MAVKTDMSKAYDHVEWRFLEKLMEKMGFDLQWNKWIMYYVSSITYVVLINDNSHGFNVVLDNETRYLPSYSSYVQKRWYCFECLGTKRSTKWRPSFSLWPSSGHLLFTDDSMLMCRANKEESSELKKCLRIYGEASAHDINYKKSSIIF